MLTNTFKLLNVCFDLIDKLYLKSHIERRHKVPGEMYDRNMARKAKTTHRCCFVSGYLLRKSQRQTEFNSKQSLKSIFSAIINHTNIFCFVFQTHIGLNRNCCPYLRCVRDSSIFLPDSFDDAPRLWLVRLIYCTNVSNQPLRHKATHQLRNRETLSSRLQELSCQP